MSSIAIYRERAIIVSPALDDLNVRGSDTETGGLALLPNRSRADTALGDISLCARAHQSLLFSL
jgi:hypothetical protein